MSSDSNTGGRRRYRRSGKRQGQSGGRRTEYRPESSASEKPEEKKPSFLQKIVRLIKGEPAAPAKKASAPRQRSEESTGASRTREPRKERERPAIRKPEAVEVTSPRLYVGNLSFDATESDLMELFNGVGMVQNVEIVSNKHTMRSKGFGFVQMQTIEEARRAVAELHDKEYMGRKMVVSGAKALEERDSDRPRQEQQPEQ